MKTRKQLSEEIQAMQRRAESAEADWQQAEAENKRLRRQLRKALAENAYLRRCIEQDNILREATRNKR